MLDIKVSGVQSAIDSLNIFNLMLKTKMDIVIARLMDEGYTVASYAYATSTYAGSHDLVLDLPRWEGNKMVLSAHGESVAFIEFGTGTFYQRYPSKMFGDGGSPYRTLGMAYRGKYGKGKGKNPPWVYVGEVGDTIGFGQTRVLARKKDGRLVVRTMGNPPARGMYEASRVVANKRRAWQIAKEVFNT